MLFSWVKKCISSLIKLLEFCFECAVFVIFLSCGMKLYFWLNVSKSIEKTDLARRFIGQSDSSDSTDLANYRGYAASRPDLEFSRIKESRYSAVGYGIEIKDWDEYVDQLHLVYKLTPEVVGILKLSKYQKYGQFDPNSFFNLDRSSGEGDYLRLIVEHKNGKINFALAGNRVNFHIAPIREVLTQTTTFLWVFSWTKERVDIQPRYLTLVEKQQLENYFIGRAVENFVTQSGKKALEFEREYNSQDNSNDWDGIFNQKLM